MIKSILTISMLLTAGLGFLSIVNNSFATNNATSTLEQSNDIQSSPESYSTDDDDDSGEDMIQNTKQPQPQLQQQESLNSKPPDETISELTTSERDSVIQQVIQIIDDYLNNPTQDQTTEICFQKVEDNCKNSLIMTFVMDDSGGDVFAGGDPLKGLNVNKPGAEPCPPPPPKGSQQGNTIINPFKC